MDIRRWLDELGLGQYADSFENNDIDETVLPQLTDADLMTLGIVSLGHRKRVLAAIAEGRHASGSGAPDSSGVSGVSETPAGERRQVTVLFADLSGFTALSQSLDPEELRELVERFMRLVDDIVLSYGGTIDKHIGDAVMALFGAPRAHDTDPLRAARAALDIHAGLAAQAAEGLRALHAHIGIASGEVVAGSIDRADLRDYTVLGDSVNLAARLVDAAGPGQTLLADSVQRALGDAVVCEPAGQMQFKGIETPVRIWRLTGATDAAPTRKRLFVGRKAELEQFTGITGICVRERAGHVIHVRGDAGIGKTRLVDEMRRDAVARGFAVHRGLVLDFGVGKRQDPIRAVVESLLGLAPSDSLEARGARVQAALDAGDIGNDQIVFLNDLLDLPQAGEWRSLHDALDNTARVRGKRRLIDTLTRACCARGPLMIVIEDLHWADPQTVASLGTFATGISDGPGVLVLTSRIEGDPIDAAWRTACRGTPIATIDLGPLRRDDALHLAGNYLDATQRVAIECIERAGGNPLFLEQLLRNAEEGREESIPASIQSLVLARMDRLAAADRAAFQAAAVIGQRFNLDLLRHLLGSAGYDCHALVANALVVPEGDDYLFAHALIQEAAYSTLLRTTRRELHRRAAAWFGSTDPVLRAQHLDRADDTGAAHACLEAAMALRGDYSLDAALRVAARGIEIASEAADRHALLCLQGEIQRDLGDVVASIATYRRALATAPDKPAECRAQIGLAEGLRVSEGLAEACSLLDAAEQTAEVHAMWSELAELHHLRGNLMFPLGDVDGCHAEHEKGLVYARRTGSAEAEARALGGLGDAAYGQGRMHTAFGHFSQCVEISHAHGFGRIEVAHRSMIGFSRIYLNNARQARDDVTAAVHAASMVGQPRAEMLGEALGVFSNMELGNAEETRVHLDRELRLIRQLGARRFEAQNIEMRARLLIDERRLREAHDALIDSLAISREVGSQFSAPKALGALALACDDPAERRAALAEGEALLLRGAVAHNHFWFCRDAIEAMLEVGDVDEASRYVAMLRAASQRESLPWVEMFVSRGEALVRVARSPLDEGLRTDLQHIRDTLTSAGYQRYVRAIDLAFAGVAP